MPDRQAFRTCLTFLFVGTAIMSSRQAFPSCLKNDSRYDPPGLLLNCWLYFLGRRRRRFHLHSSAEDLTLSLWDVLAQLCDLVVDILVINLFFGCLLFRHLGHT